MSTGLPSERAGPWYLNSEQIENSPSRQYYVRKYGTVERARTREQEARQTTCAFLQESGQKLRLPQLSIATAIVFYHRFYARESYESYERFQVATTCLFLASKVEETPKKLKDVILECYKVQHNTVQPPDPDSHDLHKLKEQVLVCERELLRVLGFDLSVEHAYRPLLAYIKSISGTRDLAQIAWNFINDSLRTTICLQYAPRCLAAAAAMMASNYLEAKLQKPCPLPAHPPGTGGKWYDAFQVREHTINEIVRLIQQMYDDNKSGGSVQLANSGAVAKMSMGAAAAANGSSKPSGGSSSVGGGKGEASSRDSNSDMTWGRSEGSERKRDSEREPTLKRGSSGDGAHSGGGAAASNAKADQAKALKADELEEGEVAPSPKVKRPRNDNEG